MTTAVALLRLVTRASSTSPCTTPAGLPIVSAVRPAPLATALLR
ncbi:hypothetical protein [Nannocystis pusilla]